MVFNTSAGTGLLQESVNRLQIISSEWILGLLLTILVLLLITRNVEKWVEWGFPVSLMLLLLGVEIHLLQTVTSFILMGITIMNKNNLGNFIDSIPLLAQRKEKQMIKKHIKKTKKKNVLSSINKREELFNKLDGQAKYDKARIAEMIKKLK